MTTGETQPPDEFTSSEAYRWRLAQRNLAEAEALNVNTLDPAERTRRWGRLLADVDDLLKLAVDVGKRKCRRREDDARDSQAS